jgi:hypothetical protein
VEKYAKGFKEKIKPVRNAAGEEIVEPFRDAQVALQRAEFTNIQREQFFNEAFQDILVKLFEKWLKSEPHAVKEREFLYHTALALGQVKHQLIEYDTFGANAAAHLRAKEEQPK